MECVLSIDLGTSAIKIALFDNHGRMLASSNQEYLLLTPQSGFVEVAIETYWDAFKQGVADVLAKSGISSDTIKAIGISAQGETLITIDEHGTPLRNAIVWMDNRSELEAEELSRRFSDTEVNEITGQVSIVPTWPATKILWIKKHEPEIFNAAAKFLLIEDYFIYRLTGVFAAEGSLLCSTVYWDIRTKEYWKEMLDALGISEDQLPEIYESGKPVGTVLGDVADELGLSEQTQVCTGVLDQVAGAIGVGNVKSGIFSECTGSALAIVATVDDPFTDPTQNMPCHYHGIPNRYLAHTFTTGGMALKWFRDNFYMDNPENEDVYQRMDKDAAAIASGCDGLVMLPHLQGAMAPENNPKAKGVFFGVTLAHTRAHFARSIMEGIAFILKRNIEIVEEMGITVDEIRSLGGGAKSAFWNQLKADVTGKSVVTTNNKEEACLGAAIVAGAGVGLFADVEEAAQSMVEIEQRYDPVPENTAVYESIYKKYKDLYSALVPVFE